MSAESDRKLFTIEDCYSMLRAGILREGDRLELIRGEILKMSPIGPAHSAIVDRVAAAFTTLAAKTANVRVQGTVVLDQFSAPQPDVALLRPRDDFYIHQHPGADDILLIVEVSDSSLRYDTTVKLELYATMGIHDYWVADLGNDRMFCYSEPAEGTYRNIRECRRGDVLTPQLLPDCQLKADILLP
jgi:Uma2 family endonuclease